MSMDVTSTDTSLILVVQPETNESGQTPTSKKATKRIFQAAKSKVKCLVWLVQIILCISVLLCLVLSKITFIKIATDLYILSNYKNSSDYEFGLDIPAQQHAASLYWMLFFIIMVPNTITWVRGLFNGLLSRSVLRPWPKQYSWRVSLYYTIIFLFLLPCIVHSVGNK